jgi:CRISPR-associated protein Csb2
VLASAADANRPGVEPIALLAPMTADAYVIWLGESRPPDLIKSTARKGKTSRSSPYPADSFDALLVDTTFQQEHGWTQPPGSRRVHYYRPPPATSPRRTRSYARTVVRADTALLALASDTRRAEVLPLSLRTLPQAELVHRGLVSRLGDSVCPELTGRDHEGRRLEGHRHASLLPLDLGRSGYIDHFLVHAPMGRGAEAQHALRTLRKTFSKGARAPLFVTLAGLGDKNDFLRLGDETVQELDEARVWKSKTPFVPPRHLKERRHSLEDQFRAGAGHTRSSGGQPDRCHGARGDRGSGLSSLRS